MLGEKKLYSPDEEQSYKSQWKRYLKAQEIAAIDFEISDKLATKGVLTAKFSPSRQVSLGDDVDYIVTASVIGAEVISLYKQKIADVSVDGTEKVKEIGDFNYTESLTEKTDLTGNLVILLNDQGLSVGVKSQIGEIRPFGEPELLEQQLSLGKIIGYECTCPDFKGSIRKASLTGLGDESKEWRTLGSIGACKHILALRIARKDIVSIPNDVPVIDDNSAKSKNPFSVSRFGTDKFRI